MGVNEVVRSIEMLDQEAMAEARRRQSVLTKPPGSLGLLEELSVRVAGMAGEAVPGNREKAVVVMAGDHGVCAEGVSAFPKEVTTQMLANFVSGGAAINVFAEQVGAEVLVVDIGVDCDHSPEGVIEAKVGRGTDNMCSGPAASRDRMEAAVMVGAGIVDDLVARGVNLVATGDMGIGNTTASAAILAVFSRRHPSEVVGRGTGVDQEGLKRKQEAIERALAINNPDPDDPMGVLAKVGGFEIAGLTGVILGCASRRIPVVVDGFISGAAALCASRLAPASVNYMIASHVSAERAHRLMLAETGLEPMLSLEMRLGEGTGAVLAMPLVEAALNALSGMSTFDQAGVSKEATGDEVRS